MRKRRHAVNFDNRNVVPGSPAEIYEPLYGPGNAPVFLSPEDFENQDRPYPSTDPFHENSNLIESSRVTRLARIMVNIQKSAGLASRRVNREVY